MVEILDPKKTETVLDPACGTAGFLISAYKHILKANTDAKGHSTLTPDERGRLAKNFKGYDISPDMVRLSLVNMYLHGFTDPHIHEYDTLTSEERWNEFADVILANPPFMSPKGGIKPHKRFSIQAKRSEVLFVDYMAEHLTPNGRAGIIVPEGIIFQSQTAYKDLRKMLVENALVAVVSLPAGCFNPYSGVKTSILILDKSLAKRSDTIAFFKVENDGFGLGAQRRAFDKNDLPQVKAGLDAYLHALRSRQPTADLQPTRGLIVLKGKIAANGDYNLSAERYRDGAHVGQHWKSALLSEVCTKITDGSHNPPERAQAGKLMLSSQNVFDNRLDLSSFRLVSEEDFQREDQRTTVSPGDVLLTIVGTIGRSLVVTEDMPPFMLQRSVAVLGPDHSLLQSHFLARVLQSPQLQSTLLGLAQGVAQKGVYLNALRDLQIPLPPLEVQKEIVAEIGGYQKVINGARAVLDHYRPHIPIHPDWPLERLGTLFETKSGTTPSRSKAAYFKDGTIPWVKTLDLGNGPIRSTDENITQLALDDTHLSILPVGTVLIAMYGGFNQIGRTGVLEVEATHNQAMTALLPTPRVSPYFLNAILVASKDYWKMVANSTRKDPNITKTDVLNFKLPLPPLATQQAIVAEIEAEQALVAANRELISRFEKKIQATLARIWGEEEPTAPKA
jgi:type I restriction enzyme M protein